MDVNLLTPKFNVNLLTKSYDDNLSTGSVKSGGDDLLLPVAIFFQHVSGS
jgi:hypothetical protein